MPVLSVQWNVIREKICFYIRWLFDNSEKHPYTFFFFCILIQYSPIIFAKKIVGWDSLDAYFPGFLFLVDSINELTFPSYIPFLLGGISFAENFFYGLVLNPIDIGMALIATKISPLFIFQLQFPVFAFLSVCWVYNFLLKFNNNSTHSVLGAMTYLISTLNSLHGQSSFFYSFVLLAFLLDPFYNLIKKKNIIHFIFSTVILISILIKSYFFFIPFMVLFSFLAHMYYKNRQKFFFEFKFLFSCFLAVLVYYFLFKAINSDYIQSTSDLLGDFRSPDPRLRSLIPEKMYYSSLKQIIADMVDSHILVGASWSMNSILFILPFFAQITIMFKTKDQWLSKLLILIAMILSLLAAGGIFANIHKSIPFINSVRWGFAYTHFAQLFYFAFIFLYSISLEDMSSALREKIGIFWLIIYFAFVTYSFKLGKSEELKFSLFTLFTVYFFVFKKELFYRSFMLVLVFFSFRLIKDFDNGKDEYQSLSKRYLGTNVTYNFRDVSNTSDYDPLNRNWLYNRIPSLDGYNNTIHPIFRYLKGVSEAGRIVIPLCPKKPLILKERSDYPNNDNEYLKALKKDIIDLIKRNKCKKIIDDFELTQKKLIFTGVSEATLILQNLRPFVLEKRVSALVKNMPGGLKLISHKKNEQIIFNFDINRVFDFKIFNIISFVIIILYLSLNLRNIFLKLISLRI